MTLHLDDQTNYANAFRKLTYIYFYKNRIYYSKGTTTLEHGGLLSKRLNSSKNIDLQLLIDVNHVSENA